MRKKHGVPYNDLGGLRSGLLSHYRYLAQHTGQGLLKQLAQAKEIRFG